MTSPLVLGLAGTVDYEIAWDSGVIEGLIAEYMIHAAELTAAVPVRSERDLVVVLLAFVASGTGGERFVADSRIVETFAARFDKRVTLGGTCIRAAMAMRALGISSMLHLVSMNDHTRRLLPEGCEYISSARQDTTDPHLIVQFGEGTRIRSGDIDLRAPQPNRVIFANDPPHRELMISQALGSVLADAELFLISSFNVIQDEDLLDDRLHELREHLRCLPPEALVYYEDAGFHVPALSQRVRDALIGVIDVHSMNEEELQGHVGREVDLLDPEEVAAALLELRSLIPGPTLIVHTRYWSLALGPDCHTYEAGLRGGITLASTRYRYGDDFGEEEYTQVAASPVHAAGVAFARSIERSLEGLALCLPALDIEVDEPTTIGLGDTFVGGFIAGLVRDRGATGGLLPTR